jgi:hypothetical protein
MFGATPIAAAPFASGSLVPYVVPAAMPSENVLILNPADSDAGTLTADSEVTTLGAANLLDMDPAKKWRSNGVTTAALTLVLAAPIAADTLALVAHNLSGVGTLRVRGADSEANLTAAPAVDTGWVSAWPVTGKPTTPGWPHFTSLVRWTAAGLFQYWRIDIADASLALTYLEAGRLVLGEAWQPSFNFDIGGTPLGFDSMDVQSKTPYGRTFTDRRTTSPARLFEIAFYALTVREAFDGAAEIQRLRGLWGDVICCLDPAASTDFHRFTMQGVFTAAAAYTLPPVFDAGGAMFGAGVKLRELI